VSLLKNLDIMPGSIDEKVTDAVLSLTTRLKRSAVLTIVNSNPPQPEATGNKISLLAPFGSRN
jgi:hypothetical protein